MNPFDIFIPILINPLINLLLGLYHLAGLIHLPGELGWAIIFLTVLIRLLVYPVYASQLRGQKTMNILKPHLSELKKKHGKDRRKLQEEQLKLYKLHGYNPASGILTLLIQLPILLGLYNVFFSILNGAADKAADHLNAAAYSDVLKITTLNENFFGLLLSTSPSAAGLSSPLILIPIVTGLLQLVLAKMTQPAVVAKTKNEASFEDALASSQSTMLFLFPIMTGYFAYSFPLGLSLYWNVANIFAIIQQYLIAGPGGLTTWLPKKLIPAK